MRVWAIILSGAFVLGAAAADVTKGEFSAAREGDKLERKSEAKNTASRYPFYGTLDSVDVKNKTVTLKGKEKNRVILFTSATRVQKDGANAKIEELVPGERVSGSVRKNAEGKEEALTIRSAPKKSAQ